MFLNGKILKKWKKLSQLSCCFCVKMGVIINSLLSYCYKRQQNLQGPRLYWVLTGADSGTGTHVWNGHCTYILDPSHKGWKWNSYTNIFKLYTNTEKWLQFHGDSLCSFVVTVCAISWWQFVQFRGNSLCSFMLTVCAVLCLNRPWSLG